MAGLFVILLGADDSADQKLAKQALRSQSIDVMLHVVPSAEEALRYLARSEDGDVASLWPHLILLDLNMPGMGGREFLMHVKSRPHLCTIPVVVLTTSDSEDDIQACYAMQSAGYVQKPSGGDLKRIMENLLMYWFGYGAVVQGPQSIVRSQNVCDATAVHEPGGANWKG